MHLSSPKMTFDKRLLALEEEFRQRRFLLAQKELRAIQEEEYKEQPHQYGLYLLLCAECDFFEDKYKSAIKHGLQAAKIFAGFPLNRRYGRIQLVLSKAYSALGDLRNAEIRARDSIAAFRRASDKEGQVDSINQLAGIQYLRCDYSAAASYIEDVLTMVSDDPRKVAQLTANLGRTHLRAGRWDKAEVYLREAAQYNDSIHNETALAANLLSLGLLRLRRREFAASKRTLDEALEIINKLDLKSDRVIYLEYSGELALEMRDFYRAKAILDEAYQRGIMLAPSSALVSQSGRRLAEAELALDNTDDAMKYGQKALELSIALGEKLEITLSHRVIAQTFAAQSDFDSAFEHIDQSIAFLRKISEPFELARTLLVQVDLLLQAESEHYDAIRANLDESNRIFRRLGIEYHVAGT